jgi:hypothetical protein
MEGRALKRRTRMILYIATTTSVALGVTSFAAPAQAQPQVQLGQVVTDPNAVPGLVSPGAGDNAPYVDEQGRVIGLAAGGGSSMPTTAASSCQPIGLPDDPHYSSPDVSGHGQWELGTCTSNTAHVYNCLYEWYTDSTWRRKACSAVVQLKPKSQSNNRTTARRTCDSTAQSISWRNHVDVDVDGQNDPPDTPYHQTNVFCTVSGADQ